MSPQINPSIPIAGQPNLSEEPKIVTALSQLVAAVNNVDAAQIVDGTITATELAAAVADALGVNTATIRRGKSIIAATETRTNAAYGLMTTPDRVQNVVLPTDGLIYVAYQATWQESVNSASRAAIFVGANQLKLADGTLTAPQVQEASNGSGTASIDKPLSTSPRGLTGSGVGGGTVYGGDVTTGQVVGQDFATGICVLFAAAGTYDISVQFKSTSGSVTVKNRRLWVWTLGF